MFISEKVIQNPLYLFSHPPVPQETPEPLSQETLEEDDLELESVSQETLEEGGLEAKRLNQLAKLARLEQVAKGRMIKIPPSVLERELLVALLRGKTGIMQNKLQAIADLESPDESEKRKSKTISEEVFLPRFGELKDYLYLKISDPLKRLELCLLLLDYSSRFFSKQASEPGLPIEEERWNKLITKTQDEFFKVLEVMFLRRASKINSQEIILFMQHGDEEGKAKTEWRHIHKFRKTGDSVTYFILHHILSSRIDRKQSVDKYTKEEITSLKQTQCLYRIKAIINLAEEAKARGNFHLFMYLTGILDLSRVTRLRRVWDEFKTNPLHQNSFRSQENLIREIDPKDKFRPCRDLMQAYNKEGIIPHVPPFLSILHELEKEINAEKKRISLLNSEAKELKLELLVKDPDQFEKIHIPYLQKKLKNARKKRDNKNKSTKPKEEERKLLAKSSYQKLLKKCDNLTELEISAKKALSDQRKNNFTSSNEIIELYQYILEGKENQKKQNFDLLLQWFVDMKKRFDSQKQTPSAIWALPLSTWLKTHYDDDEYWKLSYKIEPIQETNVKTKKKHLRISSIFPLLVKEELTPEQKREKEIKRQEKAKEIKSIHWF